MKRFLLLLFTVMTIVPTVSKGEDFLGAPLPPGGEIVNKSDIRVEKSYPLSYEEAIGFYRKALKDEADIKFWERGREVKIEEYNVRPWHSITITKTEGGGYQDNHQERQLELDYGNPNPEVYGGFWSSCRIVYSPFHCRFHRC